MEVSVKYMEAGQAPSAEMSLYERAWDEFIELRVMDREAWVRRHTMLLTSLDRFELVALVDGHPIGGLILIVEYDVHVGPCMAVQANYVLPEYRSREIGSRIFRAAVKLTKDNGFSILAFTHRVKDWQYVTHYRRLT